MSYSNNFLYNYNISSSTVMFEMVPEVKNNNKITLAYFFLHPLG